MKTESIEKLIEMGSRKEGFDPAVLSILNAEGIQLDFIPEGIKWRRQ